jgi:hypothetical protein
MSAVMLGDIGQLPKASKPAEGVNYRALAGEVLRLRADLPRLWADMPEAGRAGLYALALERATARPTLLKAVRVAPAVLRSYRAGTLEDFAHYAQASALIWDDILSLSENDSPAFRQDFSAAVEEARTAERGPALHTRQDIDEWLRTLV